MKTCAFTGHRPKSVDMYAAEIVLALKEKYPQITLECAIPYERQAAYWSESLRDRYFSIAEQWTRRRCYSGSTRWTVCGNGTGIW